MMLRMLRSLIKRKMTKNKIEIYPPPGPRLNELMAEKVMGWYKERTLGYTWWRYENGDSGYVDQPQTYREDPDYWDPSIDIACAWEIVQKLQDTHYFQLSGYDGIEKCSCYFIDRDNERGKDGCVDGIETIPHAICLAALKIKDQSSK